MIGFIMKKVLFLIPTLDKGGAENVLVNLVNNMDYSKFDITVQTLFDKDSQKGILSPEISYKSYLYKQFKGNSRLFSRIPATLLYKHIVKEKYDIVVSYLEGPTAHIISGCPYESTKKVAWIHVELDNDKSFSAGFKSKNTAINAYSDYDKIVFVADTVKKQFETTAGKFFPQGVTLYNTVDSNLIVSKSKEPVTDIRFLDGELNIISVGRIVPAKGYDQLCRVHKRLIDEEIFHHIYILGTGYQQKEIEHYIQTYDLQKSFSFIGFRDNPYKYMAKADLFICSSRREGFSTAVTESLVVGTPVISTNCSGAYELLGYNNEYGIVTENNEEALYQGIKSLLDDTELLTHYKKKAQERGNMFSSEKTVQAVEDMLLSL